MYTEAGQWGNSIGLRIPSKMAKEVGMAVGTKTKMEVQEGRLIVTPVASRHSWQEIMESLERAGRQEEIGGGCEVGNEIVEW